MAKTPPEVSDEKAIVSFRLAYRLTNWLKDASAKRGWSMNEYVARVLDGLRDGWSLPIMIRDVLDADRKAMGMDEYDYICHLVATRYNEIRDKGGPGFEKKAKGAQVRRPARVKALRGLGSAP